MRIWANPACDELLRSCLNDGMHFSQVVTAFAEKLGICISRNAIIGRAHRLDLCIPRPPKKQDTLARRSRRLQLSPPKTASPKTVPPLALLNCGQVTLYDLERHHCRYPNDKADLYCGEPRLENSSYCAAHHRLCYVKARYFG